MLRHGQTSPPRGVRALLVLAATLAASIGAIGGAARAQSANDATARPTATVSATTVGDLIVTATKHDVALRKVPAALAVVTGEALADAGPITNTGNVLASVPGARFNNLESTALSEVAIRGSGTERATNADSSVGLFSNGSYVGGGGGYGRDFAAIDYFDLDRAEVLEGPQGALYGRNAEFGTVNLISARPSFEETGYVDDSYIFQLKQNQLTAVVNHPINDDWAVRFGVQDISQSGGFILNPDSGKYYDSTSGWMARGQIRYRHGPLDVDLLAETEDMSLPVFATSYVIPVGYALVPQGFTQNRFSLPENGQFNTGDRVNDVNLIVNYDFGWATLTSTSMLRNRNTPLAYDSDYLDLKQEAAFQLAGEKGLWPLGQFSADDDARLLAHQDIHLGGDALDKRLTWLIGGDYLYQNSVSTVIQTANPCATAKAPNLTVGQGICGGTPTDHVCYLLTPTSTPCPATFPAQFGSFATNGLLYESEAVYGSLAYELGWGLTLTGDARYTNDNKTGSINQLGLYTSSPYTFNTGGTVAPESLAFKRSIPTYNGTLSYKLPGSWGDILYVKAGTGYRAGGFNYAVSPPGVTPVPIRHNYDDETTTSYEAGFKGDITPYVYFTIDGYMSRTANGLAAVGDGCALTNACEQGAVAFTVNAGTVHAHGIEAEINTKFDLAGGTMNLEADGSTQSATYVAVPTTFSGLPLVGSSVAQTPKWLAGATMNYRHSFGEFDGFLNVVYHGQWGGVQDSVTPSAPATPLSDFNNIDLRTGVDYKHLEFAFFAQNLTNQSYVLIRFNQATSGVGVAALPLQVRWNEPRTLGVEAKYKW